MIAYLKGTVVEAAADSVVIEAGGVGYEVHCAAASLRHALSGRALELFICETTALYGGGTTLYGFASREEKDIFLALREHVPGTGAKKALEHLDKASRSLPDFRRAVLEGDTRILAGVFGFTKKTAEKLVAALKDALGPVASAGRGARGIASSAPGPAARVLQQAMDALLAMGYKPAEARQSLESVLAGLSGGESPRPGREAGVEDLIRGALKQLSPA